MRRKSTVITLQASLVKHQTKTFIMNGSDQLPIFLADFISSPVRE
jgi:hypothetical protein